MFSKNISDMRYRTPRTMNEAFGAHAKLHIPQDKTSPIASVLWILFYGVAIGSFWYLLILMRAAS